MRRGFTARYGLVTRKLYGANSLPIFFGAFRKRVFVTARQLVPFAKLWDQFLYESRSITETNCIQGDFIFVLPPFSAFLGPSDLCSPFRTLMKCELGFSRFWLLLRAALLRTDELRTVLEWSGWEIWVAWRATCFIHNIPLFNALLFHLCLFRWLYRIQLDRGDLQLFLWRVSCISFDKHTVLVEFPVKL